MSSSKTKQPMDNSTGDLQELDNDIKNVLTADDYAAIYARKSNPRYSHSIDSQIDLGIEKVEDLGLVLYKVYIDEKSASERAKSKRDEFEQLLTDIKLGKFKTLIVFKRDRLSRKLDELLELRRFFKNHNIRVYYSDKNEFTPSNDDYYSKFIENIIMAISKWEPDKINERTALGKQAKWERREYAHGLHVPFGYEAVMIEGEVTKYVHDKHKSELIEKMMQLYVHSDKESDLNNLMKEIVAAGGNENPSYYIVNPVYAGLQWKGSAKKITDIFTMNETTEEYYVPDSNRLKFLTNVTPIVDEELWYKAITLWRNNHTTRTKTMHTYIFKELVDCHYCNEKLSIQSFYYRCTNEDCKKTSISVDMLEEKLIKRVLKDLLNDSFVLSYTKKLKKSVEASIHKHQNDLEKISEEIQEDLMNYSNHLDYSFLITRVKDKLEKEKSIQLELHSQQHRLYNLQYLRQNIESITTENTLFMQGFSGKAVQKKLQIYSL